MSASEPDRDPAPPSGTVTFLFSDIEGSTKLVESLGGRWPAVLQRHRDIMRAAFASHGGVERGTEGDSFFVAFPDAIGAVAAAAVATRDLAAVDWPTDAGVHVRIGLHTGEGRLAAGDYVGMDVHRAARIAAAGHGGQVLLSQSTRVLTERGLPAGVSVRDMGEHRLKDLPAPEHLYQLVIDGERNDFPPLRSLARSVANLPAQLPSIVGRDADLEAVRADLGRSRLVTVTGPGGIGKTRLIQEVARAIVANEATDVVFVAFEALTDADLMPIEILRALRLDTAAPRDPLDRLTEYLAARTTLLVLDNLEHLTGAGLVVRTILDRAANASVLVSTQAALHVTGEQEYALRPLGLSAAVPAGPADMEGLAAAPAVALFVERARAVRGDFELNAANASAVSAICDRLEGLPLAIELAAAQVKLLSPQAILQRLDVTLDALASRRADVPARQRTLRATVTWSYELLGEEERRLFRRMAVFSGGARLAEVEAIAAVAPPLADPVDVLGTLVDRSLVNVRQAAEDDRFGLFETMRTYALALLREHGESDVTSAQHARTYRDFVRGAEPRLYGIERGVWLDRIAAEQGNLRAAFDALLAMDLLSDALAMAADLWRFWQQRGHFQEGIERLDNLLAAAEQSGPPAISPFVVSRAEEAVGSLRYWLAPDRREAQRRYESSLAHAIESGDRDREAWARYNLAFSYDFVPEGFGVPDIPRAMALREEALDIFRAVDDRRGIGESLWAMGGSAQLVFHDSAAARQRLNEAVPILEEVGDVFAIGWANISLGMIDSIEGQLAAAERRVLAAADIFTRGGDVTGQVLAVQHLGAIAARRGDAVTAVRFNAAAVAAASSFGSEPPPIPPIVDPLREAVASLAPEDLTREQEIGRALGVEAILSTALESWRAGPRGATAGP